MTTSSCNSKTIFQWLLSLGAPLAVMVIPINETFTEQMRLYLAITLLGILFFAFGNIKQTVVAFALPFAYVLSGVTTIDVVFRPWTMTTVWMFIGSFFLINALTRCGLLNRIAYKTIILFGGSYYGIFIGMGFLGLILAIITGGAGTIPMFALAIGICQALKLEKFSKEATGIFIVAALAGAVPGYVFYNSTTVMILAIGSSVGGPATIGWFEHFLLGVPLLVYYACCILLAAFLFKPSKKDAAANDKQYFIERCQEMGPISADEKKSLAVIILMLLFMMTATWTGVDTSYGFIIFPLLLYLPGINVGTEEDLKSFDFGFVLFVAACLGIGMTGGSLGFGDLVGEAFLPLLQGQSAYVFGGAVWLIGFVLNFLLTPMAIYASFAAPLTALAMNLGINPLTTYFLLFFGADQVIFPYECALYLIFFSYGVVQMKDFIKYFALRVFLSLILLFVVALPFYQFIGYLYI